jgi:hypothetical protein
MYDKNFIFKANVININNQVDLPVINKQGIIGV